MVRDMKFHVYNEEHEPLCWEGKALEFDTRDTVHAFLRDVDEELLEQVVIIEDILYYDDGYINATNLRISEDGEELVPIQEVVND